MIKLNPYYDSMYNLEIDLMNMIIPSICIAEYCSDSENRQYPHCNLFGTRLCPSNKFNTSILINKILEKLIICEETDESL